jgi:hypothetical protein
MAKGAAHDMNADQGGQFTSLKLIKTLKNHEMKNSVDDKGRRRDNVLIDDF